MTRLTKYLQSRSFPLVSKRNKPVALRYAQSLALLAAIHAAPEVVTTLKAMRRMDDLIERTQRASHEFAGYTVKSETNEKYAAPFNTTGNIELAAQVNEEYHAEIAEMLAKV